MQESAAYDTIEVLSSNASVPDETWTYPGEGGCGNSSTTLVRTHNAPPTSVKSWYDKYSEYEYFENRHVNGRTGDKSGLPFRMTNYQHGSEKIYNYLTKVLTMSSTQTQVFREYGRTYRLPGYACGMHRDSETREDCDTSWNVVTHSDGSTVVRTVSSFDQGDIDNAIQKVRTSIAEKALTSWDVFTDMAEAREIPSLVRDVSKSLYAIIGAMHGKFSPAMVKAFSRHSIVDLLKHPDKVVRLLGKHWMQYRYGIMPLVYSYRDAMKAIDRGTIVRDRSAQIVLARPTFVTLPTTDHVKVEVDGHIRISASSIQRFSSTTIAKLSALGTNPLATAWELVPYSFVFDWFVNVGDYINAHTSQTYADQTQACISRHDAYSTSRYRYFAGLSLTRNYQRDFNLPREGPTPTAVTKPAFVRPAQYQLRQKTVVDRYSREVISLRAVPLRFKPSLNWRRLVDAAVMSNGLLKAGYSRFIYNSMKPAFRFYARQKWKWDRQTVLDDIADYNYSQHVNPYDD